MKHRNPAANCGNCPMWRELSGSGFGPCHLSPPDNITKMPAASEWCGQHPDFWQEDAEMSAPTPDIGGVACVTGCFEAPDTPRAWGDGVTEAIRRKPAPIDTSARADRIVELIDALEKANAEADSLRHELEVTQAEVGMVEAELADLRERHERLRAHCDGIAEKVRGLDMWRSNGGVLSVGVNDVLSIVEDDAP